MERLVRILFVDGNQAVMTSSAKTFGEAVKGKIGFFDVKNKKILPLDSFAKTKDFYIGVKGQGLGEIISKENVNYITLQERVEPKHTVKIGVLNHYAKQVYSFRLVAYSRSMLNKQDHSILINELISVDGNFNAAKANKALDTNNIIQRLNSVLLKVKAKYNDIFDITYSQITTKAQDNEETPVDLTQVNPQSIEKFISTKKVVNEDNNKLNNIRVLITLTFNKPAAEKYISKNLKYSYPSDIWVEALPVENFKIENPDKGSLEVTNVMEEGDGYDLREKEYKYGSNSYIVYTTTNTEKKKFDFKSKVDSKYDQISINYNKPSIKGGNEESMTTVLCIERKGNTKTTLNSALTFFNKITEKLNFPTLVVKT